MTPWNPLNVFSGPPRRAASDHPSSEFDPSRTGDPIVPSPGRPAIGFGHTRVDGPAGYGDPRRRPVGFAPPEDETAEPRYRTELSLKRHHETPRASATPDKPNDNPVTQWRTPAPLDPEQNLDAKGAAAADVSASEESIPFYKREISFRRKRNASEETPVASGEAEDEDAETAVAVAAQTAEIEAVDADPHATEVNAAEVAADAETGDADAASESSATLVESDENEEPLEWPSAQPVAEVDDPGAGEEPEEDLRAELVAEPASTDDLVEEALVAESAESVAGTGGSGDTLDSVSPDEVELPSSETVEAKPRFSARKDRSTQKAPKRKAARGGKGHRVVGLKIGASQIAAAVVVETDEGHELVELARRPLAAGIVVDGEVRDSDALANALRSFFDEENLPKKDVRIGLASNRIGVRTLDIAGIEDDAKFDNAVRFKAHEVLPVAAHESVLDYRVLDERPNEAGEMLRRVLLVVAPRDQVEPFVEVANRAGIKLSGVDLEALGLLRAFVEPRPFALRTVDDTATVVVAIGHESSTLLVAAGGMCEFTRVFGWGGGALQEAIVEELEVPAAEAETILRHLSLSGPGRKLESLDDSKRARAVDAIRTRLTPFARELVTSLQFYQTQPESLGIGEILVTGGTSHLEGLGEALNQMIGVKVTVGDPLARVSSSVTSAPWIDASIGSLAVPIGLAIDDIAMRSVNLMPRDAVKQRSMRSSLAAVGVPVAAVIPLVAVGALYFSAHGTVSSRQSELDAVQAQIAALPKPQGPTLDPRLAGMDAQRAVGVANVLGGRIAWEQMFRDVARVLPDNVWLDGMTATAPAEVTPAAVATAAAVTQAGAPTDVTITGSTYTQTDVARLLARLATLPSLSNVVLVSSTVQETPGQKPTVKFNIVAGLRTAGGAS